MFPNEPAAVNNGFAAVFKNRAFMLLWIGQLISQLADKVLLVLLIALLDNYPIASGLEDTRRSNLFMAFTVPAILFGSVGGVVVDRVPKKLIMVGSDVLRGIVTLLIPFLPRQFQLLLLVTFAISTVTQFFAPAEQAAIPLLVRKESLMAANALFSSTMMGALIVGNAVGPPMLNWAESFNGSFGKELIVGVLYLLSAAIMLPIHFKENKRPLDDSSTLNPWREFKDGLRYLKKNKLVWNAMLQLVTLYCVFAALIELAIRLAEELGLKEKNFSFFLAAAGVGMVLGSGILGHCGEKIHHKPLPLIGFLGMSVVLAMFTFTHNLPLALGLCIMLGVGAGMIAVPMQTLIQQQTPPAMHGKVFGFQNHAINIALSAPLLITERLANYFGLRAVLLGMSLTVAVVGVWAWQNTRKVLQDVI